MSLALRKAVFDALSGISATIYDNAPLDTTLPYVDMGEMFERDWGTKTNDGTETDITIHIWSNYQGSKEAQSIAGEVKTALHNASLTVVGETLVLIRWQTTHIFRDADEETIHGVMDFKALTHE